MRIIFLLVLLLVNLSAIADTTYVTSKTDTRLMDYKDSLQSYETGKSVCENLAILFQKLTNSHDYDSYFLDAWTGKIKFNQPVDTLLGYSELLPNNEYPSKEENYQLSSNSDIGKKITLQFFRLDTIKTIPYAKVVGAEMPVVYIYRKPSLEVVYKKLDRCWEAKRKYSIRDLTTYFIKKDIGLTVTPYNIIRYYENDKCVRTDWVNPMNKEIVLKTFGSIK
jgi:hypothetical protein